jgi:hypothetical protein
MLKPLLLATATLLPLAFCSLNNIEIASAAIKYPLVQNTQSQLLAKGDKAAHVNSQQQSDVNSIHKTLTQFFRGYNQYDVESVAQTFVVASRNDKAYLNRLFHQLKSYHVDLGIEAKKIELLTLTAHNAMVRIDISTKAIVGREAMNVQESSTLTLVKHQGKWKISNGDSVIKSIDRSR